MQHKTSHLSLAYFTPICYLLPNARYLLEASAIFIHSSLYLNLQQMIIYNIGYSLSPLYGLVPLKPSILVRNPRPGLHNDPCGVPPLGNGYNTVTRFHYSDWILGLLTCDSITGSSTWELTSVSMRYSQGGGVNTSLSRLVYCTHV